MSSIIKSWIFYFLIWTYFLLRSFGGDILSLEVGKGAVLKLKETQCLHNLNCYSKYQSNWTANSILLIFSHNQLYFFEVLYVSYLNFQLITYFSIFFFILQLGDFWNFLLRWLINYSCFKDPSLIFLYFTLLEGSF